MDVHPDRLSRIYIAARDGKDLSPNDQVYMGILLEEFPDVLGDHPQMLSNCKKAGGLTPEMKQTIVTLLDSHGTTLSRKWKLPKPARTAHSHVQAEVIKASLKHEQTKASAKKAKPAPESSE